MRVRRRRFCLRHPSGRRAFPSSRFSATSLVFSDISLVVVREEEPHPQLVAEMMFLSHELPQFFPCVSQVLLRGCFPSCFLGASEVFLGCSPGVSQVVSKVFPRCFPGFPPIFIKIC